MNSLQWKVVVAARVEKYEMTVRSEYIAGLPIKSVRAPIYHTLPGFCTREQQLATAPLSVSGISYYSYLLLWEPVSTILVRVRGTS